MAGAVCDSGRGDGVTLGGRAGDRMLVFLLILGSLAETLTR
jgi:hypothetical protein